MAATALSDVSGLTKRFYSGEKMFDLGARDRVLLSKLRKVGGWVGDGTMEHPVVIGRNQGVGAVFADAQANTTYTKALRWAITRATLYGFAHLTADVIHMVKTNRGTFANEFDRTMKDTAESMMADFSMAIYGMSGGAIGRRSGALSGNVVTLTNADDVKNFHYGMTVRAGTAEAGTSMGSGQTTVTAVDIDTGTVTLADQSQLSGFAANDYLFRDSNQAAMATGLGSPFDTTSKKGWLPNAAPTSGDSHFSVDRSTDVARLSGIRITDTNLPVEESLQEASARVRRLFPSARINDIFMNPVTYGNVIKGSAAKMFRQQGGTVETGFTGITALLQTGEAKIHTDPDCPTGRVYGLDLSTWFIQYAGPEFVHLADEDGLTWLRKSDADAYECRYRSWWNLVGQAPGRNFVCLVTG